MYEFEIDSKPYSPELVPVEVIDSFTASCREFSDVDAISLLLWEEHCTECAMPKCYTTCDLYTPRNDGKCRRFSEGISKINAVGSFLGYIVRIEFKRWGSLLSSSPLGLNKLKVAMTVEEQVNSVERLARRVPDSWLSIAGRRGISSRLARRYKRAIVEKKIQRSEASIPTHFVIETYNTLDEAADITFVIRASSGDKKSMPFQRRILVTKGFHKELIPYSDIERHINSAENHFISIVPNQADETQKAVTLYFGFIGFICTRPSNISAAKTKPVKVVVWDLDYTMWDGILVEEDPGNPVQLKPGLAHIIAELDRRGIVNSIISKNDAENALQKLKTLGVNEFFVFPEISWEPKSKAMTRIISNFNVGADTVVFIDDSPFEREEVSTQHPLVRVLDAAEYATILNLPVFNPEVSSESSRRREFYKNQKARKLAVDVFDGDYFKFVTSCQINLNLSKGIIEEVDRIHELVQRTNQMNFSGNRYNKEEILAILNNPGYDAYRLQCDDKYGDYGTIGFCVVEREQTKMIDLAFSCRVQSKRVEHAFINWLMRRYKKKGHNSFTAIFNKTDKNTQSGKVFQDLGFKLNSNGLFSHSLTVDIHDEGLINIIFSGS
jgi:FkbH-like protein